MKNGVKYGSLGLAALGAILMAYALFDKHPLSLGQSFLTVGSIFLVGGLLLSQLGKITEALAYSSHMLSQINKRDADSARERVFAAEQASSSFPPKTSSHYNFTQDAPKSIEVTASLQPSAPSLPAVTPSLPAVTPSLPAVAVPVIAATAVVATAVVATAAVVSASPVVDKPREYFNDIAKYLEPKEEATAVSLPAIETPVAVAPDVETPPVAEINATVSDAIVLPLKAEIKDNSDWLTRNQVSLNRIATDFPELDALLKKDAAAAADVELLEPAVEEVVVENIPPAPAIIREGQISGIGFRLFSDGTIEADFVNGRHRFASIADFKAYVEGA